ncbi:ArsR/SmtB family transcription factor [Paractinoplanes hotanensis]|uniref:Helix-turn-helix domain-containing protein n=1 Tax=Paractinoplanes hotanensis TaxID=2906497 RepID=A0ABT0Y6M5_9ACTN|nr:winged helix-turn-helix domain-containing protein [Actinoplanes hotanensis]MCM4081689.1 helix-turn-helix domain-containing protein [Actinoplanes hotanensis]
MPLGDEAAALRALAHPVRLRILSLLTSTPLTAAEVARELGLTHANASYHLRNLHSAGVVEAAGEEKIRGGIAKRYRYDPARDLAPESADEKEALYTALAHELLRRVAQGRWSAAAGPPAPALLGDGEFWIDPVKWRELHGTIAGAVRELHEAAQSPYTPGTIRTSTTVAMFEMESPS